MAKLAVLSKGYFMRFASQTQQLKPTIDISCCHVQEKLLGPTNSKAWVGWTGGSDHGLDHEVARCECSKRTQTCSRRSCRNTGEFLRNFLAANFSLIFVGQFLGYFSEQFLKHLSGRFSVLRSHSLSRFHHAFQSSLAEIWVALLMSTYKP